MRNRPTWLQVAALIAFLALPLLALNLKPGRYEGGLRQSRVEQKTRNASAAAIIMGEVRTNLSDMMYIKTERYMHSGVAYEPHINDGSTASQDAGTAYDGGEDDGGTIIRSAGEDFRGMIGYLERQVKPYLPPNAHAKHVAGEELLPWYRLMTLSDPHNLRAYQLGAWRLQDLGSEQAREAIKFLDEGIKHNPEAFQLYLSKGYIYRRTLKDEQKSLEAFRIAGQLAAEQRPPEAEQDSLEWTEYMEEDAAAAMRMAVMSELHYADPAKALELARKYLAILGYDGVLARQIEIMESDQAIQPLPIEGPMPQN